MTRIEKHQPVPSQRVAALPDHWPLKDAKSRFSELVRRVRTVGPQHVTVHGRDEVVIVAADELRRLQGGRTGQALIDCLQSSPLREVDLARARAPWVNRWKQKVG